MRFAKLIFKLAWARIIFFKEIVSQYRRHGLIQEMGVARF